MAGTGLRLCGLRSGLGPPGTRARAGMLSPGLSHHPAEAPGGHPLPSQLADASPTPRAAGWNSSSHGRGRTPQFPGSLGQRRRPGRAEGGGRRPGTRRAAGGAARRAGARAEAGRPRLCAARRRPLSPRRRCAPLEGGQGIKGGSGGRGHRRAHLARGPGHPAWAQRSEPRPRPSGSGGPRSPGRAGPGG